MLDCRALEAPPAAFRDEPPSTGAAGEPRPARTAPSSAASAAPRPQETAENTEADAAPPYPFDAVFSPLTAAIGRQLRAIAGKNPELYWDRFLKVGDSITKSPKFLHCLAQGSPRWGQHSELATVLGRFRDARFDSFARESLSAENGWSAWQPLHGKQPPLKRELHEVKGRYALVQFGTNDIETSRVSTFFRRLSAIVGTLTDQGVIPIVSTIPERRDRPASRAKVPIFNAAIRAVAQARAIPLIGYHRALAALPEDGLTSDGIHPSVHRQEGVVRACDFDAVGLSHGFNLKNLLTLQALQRVQRVLVDPNYSEPAPAMLEGAGTLEQPFEVALPSVSSPSAGGHRAKLPKCLAKWEKQPTGDVVSYRLRVTGVGLEALAMQVEDARPVSYWLSPVQSPTECVRGGRGYEWLRIEPGQYDLHVVSSGVPHVLAVVASRSQ